MVFIDPYHNHTAALLGDTWLAPRLGTDVALALGIAHTWLTEGTYDVGVRDTHTHGFGEWRAYVLGESDGTPKTAGLGRRGVRRAGAPDPRARARLGAQQDHACRRRPGGWGGACRASSGNEWARAMIALVAMQGLGKPGRNLWSTTSGVPFDTGFFFPGYAEGGICGDVAGRPPARSWPAALARRRLHQQPAASPRASGAAPAHPGGHAPEDSLARQGLLRLVHRVPVPEYSFPAPGYPHVKMYYRYGGSFIGTMTETNRYVTASREGEIPFVVSQSIWMEGETRFADIVLPACTNFERWDIGDWAHASGYGTTIRAGEPPASSSCRRSASSRWASPSPTTRSSPPWRASWESATSTPKAGRRSWTGPGASSRPATCPGT